MERSLEAKCVEYREEFINNYTFEKEKLMTIVTEGINRCNEKQLTEVIKLIYFDDERYKQHILSGDLSIDLRCLHCETIFQIYVYLYEVALNESLTALQVKKCCEMN